MDNFLDTWLKKTLGSEPGSKTPTPQPTPAPHSAHPHATAKPAPLTPHTHAKPHTPPPNTHKPAHPPRSGRPFPPQSGKHEPRQLIASNGNLAQLFDSNDDIVRIVPIGGLEEVGRNIEAVFYKDEILIIDCGLQFPEADMLGIDYVIPDTRVLEERKHRVKGFLITHGHMDHIGALPHILPKLGFPPVYGTRLTLALARARLTEYALDTRTTFHEVMPGRDNPLKFGKHLTAEFFRVNHSIPDATGVAITTPNGIVVHTGDFKFDFTPADKMPADFAKMAELSTRGVALLMSDSTNAMKPGFTMSESVIAQNLEEAVTKAKGRIIIATFASLIGRIQHIVNAAQKTGRTIFLSGRSMVTNIEMAVKAGYLKVPHGVLRQLKKGNDVNELPPNKVIILCTGSQGEEMSALTRISLGEHATISIKQGDTVIFSSTPIPGNETAVVSVTNNLLKRGARVVTNKHLDVHTSGHGHQEDLKLMLSLIRPKTLVPVHGELIQRSAHKDLAVAMGYEDGNVLLLDNGEVIEVAPGGIAKKGKTRVPVANIMIDGLGTGDIGTQVLRERTSMSENGIVFVMFKTGADAKLLADPEVVSRGFIYMKESATIVEETKRIAKKAYEDAWTAGKRDYKDIRSEVTPAINRFIRQRLDREPLVLPFIVKM